jgi:hypothetical protein
VILRVAFSSCLSSCDLAVCVCQSRRQVDSLLKQIGTHHFATHHFDPAPTIVYRAIIHDGTKETLFHALFPGPCCHDEIFGCTQRQSRRRWTNVSSRLEACLLLRVLLLHVPPLYIAQHLQMFHCSRGLLESCWIEYYVARRRRKRPWSWRVFSIDS